MLIKHGEPLDVRREQRNKTTRATLYLENNSEEVLWVGVLEASSLGLAYRRPVRTAVTR